jgi:hypothetical protein
VQKRFNWVNWVNREDRGKDERRTSNIQVSEDSDIEHRMGKDRGQRAEEKMNVEWGKTEDG